MRILIYGLNFSPELTGIGKYTGEMARWLATHGHEVRVITAPPYYPEWAVHPGYEERSYNRELWHGVEIFRCPLWVPRKVTGLKRLMHLASFALSSLPIAVAQFQWRPHVVWTVAPALFTAPGALLLAKLSGSRSWLHIQDYEVDAAFDMGLLGGRVLRRVMLSMESWILRSFDRTSTISGKMLELAGKKGVAPHRLIHFPNWVDVQGINPLKHPSPYRAQLGIPLDAVVVLYSGNMGAKQGLGILAEAAHALRGDERVFFVLCGQGVGREELERQCKGLPHVRFLPLQPNDRFGDLLGVADLHVLPQRAGAADLVLPSKLTGMLASGRPVIATAEVDTELGQLISRSNAGQLVAPEDAGALAAAISGLVNDPPRRKAMGVAARSFAERELEANAILGRFETELGSLVRSG